MSYKNYTLECERRLMPERWSWSHRQLSGTTLLGLCCRIIATSRVPGAFMLSYFKCTQNHQLTGRLNKQLHMVSGSRETNSSGFVSYKPANKLKGSLPKLSPVISYGHEFRKLAPSIGCVYIYMYIYMYIYIAEQFWISMCAGISDLRLEDPKSDNCDEVITISNNSSLLPYVKVCS